MTAWPTGLGKSDARLWQLKAKKNRQFQGAAWEFAWELRGMLEEQAGDPIAYQKAIELLAVLFCRRFGGRRDALSAADALHDNVLATIDAVFEGMEWPIPAT